MSGGNGRPNIVLVVLDTLTAEAAGLGRTPAPMPALESLAERGSVFTHAVSNASWTYPSHASLFTGFLPSEHRMEVPLLRIPGGRQRFSRLLKRIERAAPDRNPALAERWLPAAFARAGYETVCVSNNAVVGPKTHMDHGFEHVEGVAFTDLFRPPRIVRRSRRLNNTMQAANYTYRLLRSRHDLRARVALSLISAWAGNRDRSRPFFLFVNLMEAHFPYFTPRSRQALRDAHADAATTYRAMRLIEVNRSFLYNMGMLPDDPRLPRALETLRSLHRHAATYLDEQIGKLHEMSARDRRGLVFVVTSDHGDAFGEHQAVFHGMTLDEPILHIPLVVEGDGVPVGERAGTVELRQVYATLLSAAGASVPAGAPPSLLQDGAPPRAVIAERDRATDTPPGLDPAPLGRERLGRMRALYRDPWKLVATETASRLFNLMNDPGETANLAGSEPAVLAELQAGLPPWPEATAEPEREEEPPSLSAQEQDEIAQQLAALGYLE